MAAKQKLQVVTENLSSIEDKPDLTIEQIVADEILDGIDWQQVKLALLAGVRRKFINWFASGNSSIAITEVEAMAIAQGEDQAA